MITEALVDSFADLERNNLTVFSLEKMSKVYIGFIVILGLFEFYLIRRLVKHRG